MHRNIYNHLILLTCETELFEIELFNYATVRKQIIKSR